jgi:hypothetical protein
VSYVSSRQRKILIRLSLLPRSEKRQKNIFGGMKIASRDAMARGKPAVPLSFMREDAP